MGSFSVGGLATGLDTKSIIDQLMQIETRPRTKLEWKAQLWTARKSAWADLNTRLLTLQNNANALLRTDTWNTSGATGVTSSDATRVTATGAAGTSVPGTHTIDVTQLAQAQVRASTGTLPGGVAPADDTLTITQGAASWTVAILAGDDLATIAAKVNATTGVGVAATVNGAGALELAATATGAASSFGVTSTGTTAATLAFAQTQAAQDASFSVDGGAAITSSSNTVITGAIDGVALNLLATTAGSVTLTVAPPSQDWIDATKKKIQDFVNQYNSVLDLVHQKTQGESRVINPKTLGEYLQGSMARDVGFSQVGFDLRETMGESVAGLAGASTMLSQLGITTSFSIGGGAANGRLVIDDAKLDAALRANPQQVQDVLGNVGAGAGITADDGIIRRISEQVSLLRTGGRVDSALTGAGNQVKDIQSSIDRSNDRLERRKAYYERMFASLEASIGRMQSQGAWLSGQFNALSQG